MAITATGPYMVPSNVPRGASSNPGYSTITIDAAAEKTATIFTVPKDGVVSKIGWRSVAVTSSGDADVRLETVDATNGDPSGTLFGTNTNGTQTVTTANTWMTTTLTAGATVTQGQKIALVIAWISGNWTTAQLSQSLWPTQYPYSDNWTTGAYIKALAPHAFALEYNDGSYAPILGVFPYAAITLRSYSNASSPAIRANRFRFPVSKRVTGFWIYGALGGDCDFKLYGSDGVTVLTGGTYSHDKDLRGSTSGSTLYTASFAADQTLLANTYYRLALVPTTATTCSPYEVSAASAAVMAAMEMGTDYHGSTSVTTPAAEGDWTQDLTARLLMGPIINGEDSGGGLKTHPGMNAFING